MEPAFFLILDTNIWRSRDFLLLNTPLAAALLFAVRRRSGILAFPEVIEMEVEKQLLMYAREEVRRWEDGWETLHILGLSGSWDEPYAEQDFQNVVPDRLEQLSALLHRMPFTLEQAKAALRRVNDEIPPNSHKNQQFKDSVIWECILELAHEADVIFVTADKGFFKDRAPNQGLAPPLQTEVEGCPKEVRVLHQSQIGHLLSELQEDMPAFDEQRALELIASALGDRIKADARTRGFETTDLSEASADAFVTEVPSVLALKFFFRMGMVCTQGENDGKIAVLFTSGSAQFNVDDQALTDVAIDFQVASAPPTAGEELDLHWVSGDATTFARHPGTPIDWPETEGSEADTI